MDGRHMPSENGTVAVEDTNSGGAVRIPNRAADSPAAKHKRESVAGRKVRRSRETAINPRNSAAAATRTPITQTATSALPNIRQTDGATGVNAAWAGVVSSACKIVSSSANEFQCASPTTIVASDEFPGEFDAFAAGATNIASTFCGALARTSACRSIGIRSRPIRIRSVESVSNGAAATNTSATVARAQRSGAARWRQTHTTANPASAAKTVAIASANRKINVSASSVIRCNSVFMIHPPLTCPRVSFAAFAAAARLRPP